MKPIRIDTSRFRMLDKENWTLECVACGKPHSKWEMLVNSPAGDQWSPVCALCFLFESKWGQDRADQITGFLTEVIAKESKRNMVLTPDKKLTVLDDADFILGILVLTSRRFDIEDFTAGRQR